MQTSLDNSGSDRFMRRPARLAALAIGLCGALVLASCGSDPDESTKPLAKDDFIAQADALCSGASEKMNAVPLPSGDPSSGTLSDADLVITSKALRALDAIETTMRSKLVALVPPTDFASKWAESMKGLQDRLDAGERAADAADAKDQSALVEEFAAYDAAGDASRGPLAGYGFTVCAGAGD